MIYFLTSSLCSCIDPTVCIIRVLKYINLVLNVLSNILCFTNIAQLISSVNVRSGLK